jgi:glycosyltransferase involved in cell wall biosynthesis
MNILVDCHAFDNEKHQGVTTYIKEMYKSLIPKMSDTNFYFCALNRNAIEDILAHKNSNFIKLMSKTSILRLAFEIPYIVYKYKIDYVHVQYKSPFFKKCKEIVTTHDVLFLDFPQFFSKKFQLINNFFYRISAKRADILLTVSNYSKERISSHYSINKDLISVTPNGISNFNKQTKLSNNTKVVFPERFVLYVSRIEPRKNHLNLLKAFDCVELKDVNLVFVGSETVKNSVLSETINKSNGQIKHLKNLSESDLVKAYKNALLTVFPSFCEGFGLPPLESVVVGTNCICSNTTAMTDYSSFMIDTFDPRNHLEIRHKIINYLHSPLEVSSVEIEKKFSWERSSQILKELILNNNKND